ncbi:uncharacterized protein UV8b_00592 [Ustilaginoidea virens]|uniref:GH16 domain-containing protein n=1 Tax=Ustilaginoidea virens TaxID=1159556 RepID=A0A8E5MDK8_USTVR|nr:uncharacterized protein UV8b_00592 [Ustilaginoidea virens]QUC16351.1 hypothetical protein UV8b_00592 [Ustilaginoidea virens]
MVKFPAVITASLVALAPLIQAWNAPPYHGFSLRWQDPFSGGSGRSPDPGNWNIINGFLNVNNELQTYSSSTRNVQLSGGSTVQIVPWRDESTIQGWTSGRMESKYVFTPDSGRLTRVEASLRFGPSHQGAKKGIWPAWWMLGDSIRHGKQWPAGGELDILEVVNGQPVGHGTVHCHKSPGGICNEPSGIGSSVNIPNNDYHVWRLEFDRRSEDWTRQSITWFLDGHRFHQITGSGIGDHGTWATLCHSPTFFILNLAVGGDWPGKPDGATQDGYGAMMEIGYVAHYVSS